MDDAISQAMSQVIGSNPLLGMFQAPIRTFLYDQLGLAGPGYRDTFLDTVLTSNMTPYGVSQELFNRRIQQVSNDAMKRRALKAKQGFFADVGRTLLSYDSWREQQEDGADLSEAAYNAFINNEAAGKASNPIWNFLYNTMDPDGLGMANEYLAKAGANQIRRGRWAGRRGALLQARAVGDLFLNDKGEYQYDKTDYGYMTVGESAAVAAAITKDQDFFQGVGVRPEDLKKASENLRNSVQAYTKALSPLKDLFGSDVPAMIQAIEQLSGQKLSQMDPVHLGETVKRVMAGATAGNYTLQQLTDMNTKVSSAITQMNVPYINDLGALAQSMTVLDMTSSGPGPSFMSAARFANMAGDLVMRSSNSAGAQAINQAYAIWRQTNENGTLQGFLDKYNALRKNNRTADEALLEISGQNSMYALEVAGTGSRYYQEAVRANLGGTAAILENVNSYIDTARFRATNEQHGAAFEEAIKAVQDNVSLLSNTQALMDSSLSAEAKAEVLRISNGHYGANLSMSLVAYDQAEKSRRRTERQIKAMESSERIKALPSSAKEAFRSFLAGDLTYQKLVDITQDIKTLLPEDQEMLKYSLEAAQMLQPVLGRMGADDTLNYQEEFVKYSLNNGMTNALFTQKQLEYEDLMRRAENPGENESAQDLKAEALQAANMMHIYRYADESLVTQWLDGATGDDRKKKEDQLKALFYQKHDGKMLSAQAAGYEINDMIRADFIEAQMRAKGLNEDYIAAAMTGIRGIQSEVGIGDSAKLKQFLSEDEGLKKLGTSDMLDKAVMSVNEAFGKETSLETVLLENTNLLSKVLTSLEQYFNKEKEKDAVEANKSIPYYR